MGILHSEEEIVYHFFTETEFFTESEAVITGPDVNHIKNVLRMKPGEKLLLSDGKGTNCLCEITELFPDKVLAKILPEEVDDTELPVKVTLYQGLPKADKMEFIIQKCVELGVTKIVPVDTDRAVVKLDAKKEEAKRKRWWCPARPSLWTARARMRYTPWRAMHWPTACAPAAARSRAHRACPASPPSTPSAR